MVRTENHPGVPGTVRRMLEKFPCGTLNGSCNFRITRLFKADANVHQ
jgi:hypothetical protein